ncbi:sigma-70 family RNA polymerase sigma factor [Singulisphaera sp. PoT]|uniref:sigma-70 family RNA polymerase sigma factor n=1 Tax=Singulisphaera sp. PoT TaxID=3411797 RepID=UPI003BF5EE2E
MTIFSGRAMRRAFPPGWSAGMLGVERTDRQLLECVSRQRGEAAEMAFATLVQRHGPMVFGICRSLLADPNDAEDAFQATFLVLARKADTLRQPESLAHWLHGVALRTARKTKALGDLQRRREQQEFAMGSHEPVGDWGRVELQLVRREQAEAVHEEVARLPEAYRAPVVLCYLEGLTHVEAAERLRWPVGTLSVRLMRARKLLHGRLSRRGLAPGLLTLLTLPDGAKAVPPEALVEATAHAAARLTSQKALMTEVASRKVAHLVEEVLEGLCVEFVAPMVVALAVAVALVATCASVLAGTDAKVAEASKPVPGLVAASGIAPSEKIPGDRHETKTDAYDNEHVNKKNIAGPFEEAAPGQAASTQRVEYLRRASKAGGSPEDQVRLSLWCESQGLSAERFKHLALAILHDPTHGVARGLLGQVARDGRWIRAEDVGRLLRPNSQTASNLAEYNARRERMENNAEAHWNLALWCDRHGLKAESVAHLTAVTRLAPGKEMAWKRLGFQRWRGRWRTPESIAAEKAETDAQRKADRRWLPLLQKYRDALAEGKVRDEAVQALAGVSDPRATNAVLAVFANGDARDQALAVQVLGQIESPASTKALALLAMAGSGATVQRAACETLARRDHHEALGLLVSLLRDPEPNRKSVVYRFQMLPIGALGPASPGVTFIEGRKGNLLQFYTVDESMSYVSLMNETNGDIGMALINDAYNAWFLNNGSYQRRVGYQTIRQVANLNATIKDLIIEANTEMAIVQGAVRRTNDRLIQTLKNISGVDRDGDWQSWIRWWVEDRGYAYEPENYRTPQDTSIEQARPTVVQRLHLSCFAAGTPVRTIAGLRPIETIRVGDQVLAQDPKTGELGYETVVASVTNPPDATFRVRIEDDELLATGIHRFWVAGRGWVMARDLKPGDRVRVIGGVARVTKVNPVPSRLVYNLEVANKSSFFVGRLGSLVHDNSPVERITRPFDLAPESTEVADAH